MDDVDSALFRVQHWEASGGHWRVLSSSHGVLTIALERCDGGEEMERVVSDDPSLRDWIGDRLEP